MAKTARKLIEEACKKVGLEIVSLTYHPGITYDSGGWNLIAKCDDENFEYAAHTSTDLILDIEEAWEVLQ